MMKITKEGKLITFINVFSVDPEKQQQLVNLLIQATESSVRHVPGFISATLVSSSGRRQSRRKFSKVFVLK